MLSSIDRTDVTIMSRVSSDGNGDPGEFPGVTGVLPLKKWIIPRRVRHLRVLLGLSQVSLAQRSNLDEATIRSIERGQHDPRVSTLGQVAQGLLVQLSYIVGAELDPTAAISAGPVAADQLHTYYSGLNHAMHQPRRCRLCAIAIPSGEPHGAGNCFMALHNAGKSREFLAQTFDLRLAWVDAILDVEYGVNKVTESSL